MAVRAQEAIGRITKEEQCGWLNIFWHIKFFSYNFGIQDLTPLHPFTPTQPKNLAFFDTATQFLQINPSLAFGYRFQTKTPQRKEALYQ